MVARAGADQIQLNSNELDRTKKDLAATMDALDKTKKDLEATKDDLDRIQTTTRDDLDRVRQEHHLAMEKQALEQREAIEKLGVELEQAKVQEVLRKKKLKKAMKRNSELMVQTLMNRLYHRKQLWHELDADEIKSVKNTTAFIEKGGAGSGMYTFSLLFLSDSPLSLLLSSLSHLL